MTDSGSNQDPFPAPATRTVTGHSGVFPVHVLVSMYVGYAMFMVLRSAPGAFASSIKSGPLQFSNGDWAQITAIGTVGALCGKFVGGLAADFIGGRKTFAIGLLLTSAGMALFSVAQSMVAFKVAMFLALMAKSAGWPAMTQLVVGSFQPRTYGRVWGVLSTSSRVGTLIATLGLGFLLSWFGWRPMLQVTSVVGAAIAVVMFFSLPAMSHQSPELREGHADHPFAGKSPLNATFAFFMSARFWLIALSVACLTVMWDFLSMVTIFLTDSFQVTDAAASVTSSAFPMGSLVSVLAGGFLFDRLSRRTMSVVMGCLLIVATSCIGTFCAMPQMGLSGTEAIRLASVLLFVFGLCVSPCYYIPMSIFSIQFGGPHSGFLVSLLDAAGFAASAAFYFFLGGLADESWQTFLIALGIVSSVSAVVTWLFLRGESRIQDVLNTDKGES
mgnify:CR=1 FL=1